VITKKDSEVIEKLPEIIKSGYNKKIYVLPWIKQYVIDSINAKYYDIVNENKKRKDIKEEYLRLKRFIRDFDNTKNKKKLKIPNIDENRDLEEQIIEYYKKSKQKLEKNELLF
jgi:glutaredoxin-related protein